LLVFDRVVQPRESTPRSRVTIQVRVRTLRGLSIRRTSSDLLVERAARVGVSAHDENARDESSREFARPFASARVYAGEVNMFDRNRRRAQSAKITQLTFARRGGARRGAGRKPKGEKPLVTHAKRPRLGANTPVFVTAKLAPGLPSLRRGAARLLAWRALDAARSRFGVRVVHFSLQSNHVHAIVEARDERALGRAMKGLCGRIALALNRIAERRGRVFADRYHSRQLHTPREVRNVLAYVLNNARKHGVHVEGLDPCSSASVFDGWRERGTRVLAVLEHAIPPVAEARSWLLREGWRRHGLIGVMEVPARSWGLA
jgi:putative transposase